MSVPGIERPVAAAAFAAALVARHVAQLWLTRRRARGARSGWASTSLLFVCYVSAMVLAFVEIARLSVDGHGGHSPWGAIAAGAGLWLLAVCFRMWALAHLSEQFSSLIEIREGHRLVDTGPYSIVRHPLHLAFGLEVTAFAVAAWSLWAIPPAALAWVVVMVRKRTEEAALLAHFGAEYDAYRARVPAMNVAAGLRRLVARRRWHDNEGPHHGATEDTENSRVFLTRVILPAAVIALVAVAALTGPSAYRHWRARRILDRALSPKAGALIDGVSLYTDTAAALSELGQAGRYALLRELRSADRRRRGTTYWVLREMREDIVLTGAGDLAELVADAGADPWVRSRVADILLFYLDEVARSEIEPRLEPALEDRDPSVRGTVAAILWRLGRRGDDMIEPLSQALCALTALELSWQLVEGTAAEALRSFGAKAVPALADAVEGGDGIRAAAELLAEVGPDAAPAARALARRLGRGWGSSRFGPIPENRDVLIEHDPAARALFAIGGPATEAVREELAALPAGDKYEGGRLRLLIVLDSLGGVTPEIALADLSGDAEGPGPWGAWWLARFMVDDRSTDLWSLEELAPGKDGTPPPCFEEIARTWVFADFLDRDYEALPREYRAYGFRDGGGRRGRPWWTWGEYGTWVKALGYRRASARRVAAWLIGTEAKGDDRVRGCGKVPPALARCAEDPDPGARSAARWAIGIITGENPHGEGDR